MRGRTAIVSAFVVLLGLTALPSSPAARSSGATRDRHWIGLRERGGDIELVDHRSGDRFVPRGSNLLLKVREGDHVASGLFRPRNWNPQRIDGELRRMAGLGYNMVRVFIDLCQVDCISTSRGTIRPPYAANIAEFLRIARRHGLVVLLASNDVPDRGYSDRLPCCSPFGGYRNSLWLTGEGHDLLVEYWREVVTALRRQRAPLEVAVYQLQQEQFLLGDVEPLSLTSGSVTTADGETYDLAVPDQKTEMVASNVRLAIRRARAAIRRLDPGALVTMGFFADFEDDPRVVPSRALLASSALDLFDLHLYPGVGHDLAAQVEALGLSDAVEKPVIMGEFGAFRFAYANPRAGASALAHWQADSCTFGFEGWLTWLWAKRDGEVFGAREDSAAIARTLSPREMPDPCDASGVPTNVAPLGTATASASLPGSPPGNAIDGLAETAWSAGDLPPQWIQIDLGTVRSIREIDLVVDQFPEGETHHRLLLAPDEAVPARLVRVETASSPAWVAWSEIQVYA